MSEIQSLARGLKILDLLGSSPDGLSVTELSELFHVDKASASRLVSTLAKYGYAEKDKTTRRYHLGTQIIGLSRSMLDRLPLHETARPFLHQMVERTGECAHLAVAFQGKALYIAQVESPATLRVNAQVGTLNPLHCTALGKVLLAFSELEIPPTLERYTANTITDPQDLERNLEEVRWKGYALDQEEFDQGVSCIAAPVSDYRGKLAGAIGISGPVMRLTPEKIPELIEIVVEISQTLSERMTFNR
jgi:IclR family acetate operon transcriptional repressor